MKMNGGFLITKIKQLGDRIFEKVLSENNVDAFNGAQGRILLEKQGLITRTQDNSDKRKTLLILTDKARSLKTAYDAVSDKMGEIYYKGFSEEEIRSFESYLDRILMNLEGWEE